MHGNKSRSARQYPFISVAYWLTLGGFLNAGSKADYISHTPDVAECNGNAQMTMTPMGLINDTKNGALVCALWA